MVKCTKRQYETAEATKKALEILARRARENSFLVACKATRGYWCKECACWHLSSKPLNRRQVSTDIFLAAQGEKQ